MTGPKSVRLNGLAPPMDNSTHTVGTTTAQASRVATDASTALFSLPAEGFALTTLFEQAPDARVECESFVANPDDRVLMVVQTDEHKNVITPALRSGPGVAEAECIGQHADGWLFWLRWVDHPRRLIQRLVNAEVTLLSIQAEDRAWKLRLLTPERSGISQAQAIMNDLGCNAECQRISPLDSTDSSRSGLTKRQKDALVEAFESGHYEVPRDATADEVADELGISHQALSERLRRAHRQLIESKLAVTK